MPRTPKHSVHTHTAKRCFGLRIESNSLQLAVAIPLEGSRYRLEIDSVVCSDPGGWISISDSAQLESALTTLVSRHEIKDERVAVSLDGDFCVTRVAMGTTETVDKELSTLEVRVPRYLQLGPGEKVTGSSRRTIAPAVDYAVTGVANRTIIQLIYEALRGNDLNVAWVEPSLVSVARMLGRARIGGDRPVLIADGTGHQWDVGIACSGRLLLDYRPASATTMESLGESVEGHFSRLQRFCQRHRGIASGELRQLLICGDESKTSGAEDLLDDSINIETQVLQVPDMDDLYEIDPQFRDANNVPSVASILPLLIGTPDDDVADLLDEVRRAPDLPMISRIVRTGWPIAAAAVILAVSFLLVSGQRRQVAGASEGRIKIESQIRANQIRFSELSSKRERLSHLVRIRDQADEPDWQQILERITKSLPDSARLNSFRVESNGSVLLNGSVTDETLVFELINDFRHLPGIEQVALRGTTPEEAIQGTRFNIRLTMRQESTNSEFGERHE